MKTTFAILIAVLVVAIIALGIIILLATPRDWPITAGTIKAQKVVVDGQSFVKIDGESMNYLAQIQSINIEFDNASKRILVSRCKITMNPFSRIVVNNQFPVFYPLDGIKSGKYSVVYETKDGETVAGSFDAP